MSNLLPDASIAVQAIKNLNKMTNLTGDITVRVKRNPFLVQITWKENNFDIAGFTLTEQTNCCGILVSTKTFVAEAYRKQKIAQTMMPLKEAIAREFGYSMLLSTVNISGNPAEVHILNKTGWKQGESFINSRTNHTVAVFTKKLN